MNLLRAGIAACHRPGQVAPFSLLTYADARERAEKIATATRTRHMAPWLPMPGFGTFLNERRLTEGDVATIQAWAASGAPCRAQLRARTDILSDLGGAMADSGDVIGARAALERAVALQPNHPTAKANLQLLNARARGGR